MCFVRNARGMSIVEVLSAVGIASIVSLATASLVQTTIQSSQTVEGKLEYANLVSLTTKFLDGSQACENILSDADGGSFTYDGNRQDLQSITMNGTDYEVGEPVPGGRIYIESIRLNEIADPTARAGTDVNITVGGVEVAAKRYLTQLSIGAKRRRGGDANKGVGYKTIDVPILIYSQASDNTVAFCAADDGAQACLQLEGEYIAGDNPRCDISDAIVRNSPGGCAVGGTFTYINGRCSSVNPYTGGCTCPGGFAPATVLNYNVVKGGALVQKQCMNCSGSGNGLLGGGNQDGDLNVYTEQQLLADLACIRGDTRTCPCANPTSLACRCETEDPAPAECADPCAIDPRSIACSLAGIGGGGNNDICLIYPAICSGNLFGGGPNLGLGGEGIANGILGM